MGSIAVILALIVIVVIHEAGHFFAARAVGIRATKFYVFFPPAIWKVRRGEVEYGVGAIPLGGFVKLPGMFRPEPTEVAERLAPETRELAAGLVHERTRVEVLDALESVGDAADADTLTGPLQRLSAALDAAATGQGQAPPAGPYEGLAPQVWHRRVQKLRDRIEGVIDDAHPGAFWRASLWRRMTVIIAGPVANVLLAFAILWVVLMLFVPGYRQLQGSAIASVVVPSPASEAGIQAGDRIVRWNGRDTATMPRKQFAKVLKAGRGKTVHLTVVRGGHERAYTLVPRRIDGSGTRDRLVGVSVGPRQVRDGWDRRGPVTAASQTVRVLSSAAAQQLHAVARLVHAEQRRQVHSVVGIVQSGNAIPDVSDFAAFMAIISLVVAIMNLLPVLPLDGGHLLFGLLEFLRRGRPVPRGIFERASVVGIALMLMLFVIGLNNDIGRMTG